MSWCLWKRLQSSKDHPEINNRPFKNIKRNWIIKSHINFKFPRINSTISSKGLQGEICQSSIIPPRKMSSSIYPTYVSKINKKQTLSWFSSLKLIIPNLWSQQRLWGLFPYTQEVILLWAWIHQQHFFLKELFPAQEILILTLNPYSKTQFWGVCMHMHVLHMWCTWARSSGRQNLKTEVLWNYRLQLWHLDAIIQSLHLFILCLTF